MLPATQNHQPATSSRLEAELRKLNSEYVQSFLKSDVKRYDELLAPDFRCITPGGQLIDRATFLKAVAEPSGMASFDAEDGTIQVVGDTAIIQARTPFKRLDGAAGESRYTDIWAHRNGKWQTVSAQITPIRKP